MSHQINAKTRIEPAFMIKHFSWELCFCNENVVLPYLKRIEKIPFFDYFMTNMKLNFRIVLYKLKH